ncbi:MAG: RsmE family RNA methyltransferase [Acidimicrobiales bacterium]
MGAEKAPAGPGPVPSPAGVEAAAQVFVDDLEGLTVEVEDRRHLLDVLRLRPGEVVVACDGRGRWRGCRMTTATLRGDTTPLLEPDGPVTTTPPAVPAVTVAFVPVKGDRPEWAVQKLTEAGVDRIVVLRSVRAVVRWDEDRQVRALDRFQRVARHAAAQSRRAYLPEISGVMGLDDLAARLAPVPLALAHPGGSPPSTAVPAVAVGPEGGWDPSETGPERLLVGLGPHILRAETATVAAGLLLCALRSGLVGPPPTPSDLAPGGAGG